jgi:proliferating cell nuclear antigen
MLLEMEDASVFKGVVDAISNLVEEGVFIFDENGMRFRALDPSNIALVSVSVPSSAFSSYEVNGQERVGVSIANLNSLLARIKKGERLVIGVEDNTFSVSLRANKRSRTFKLPVLDIVENDRGEPNLQFNASVKISAEVLKQIFKDASSLSMFITIAIGEDELLLSAKGDKANMVARFDLSSPDILSFDVKGFAKATFNLEYLEDMVKACPNSEYIELNLGMDEQRGPLPIKLFYNIGPAHITYYLAPRVEEE